MTITYSETGRQNVVNGSGVIMPIEQGVFITIGLTVQLHDGSTRQLIYEDFYVTVGGVEVPAVMQLSGSWGFNVDGESSIWFIFEDIGTNYSLNYRGNSFTIEWIKQ
jgi:hypothetical protein